jgi:hypothetical protein
VDFDLSTVIDPMGYLPVGWLGWTMQLLPAAFGIWSERSGERFARGAYLISLILRAIGLLLFGSLVLYILGYLIFNHDPASSIPALDASWLVTAGMLLSAFSSIVMIRPLIWRLRDAGIEKKWAYIAVLPYLDFVMYLGLIFYPSSRSPAPVDVEVF